MTGERHRFFSRLAGQEGWRVDYLDGMGRCHCLPLRLDRWVRLLPLQLELRPLAPGGLPGLVLLIGMIEHAIDEGWGVFDFLKGDEIYKARLGGAPRRLFRVEASR